MKHVTKFLITGLIALGAFLTAHANSANSGGSTAQNEEKPRRESIYNNLTEKQQEELKDLLLLERYLDLSPETLASMRQTIERIEAMSAEEKQEIRNRIHQYMEMSPGSREEMRRRWDQISHENKRLLRRHWYSLSEEERDKERERVRTMTFSEREEYFKTLIERLRKENGKPKGKGHGSQKHQGTPEDGEK